MSQPPEIKINHQDWETISTLIRGHRSINHSLSPLWPQLTQCSLCYPHHSGCCCILHMGQLRMQIGLITESSIYFGLNGNLIRMQPLEMCLDGAILTLMKADTVSASSTSQRQTLARPLLFAAGSSPRIFHPLQRRPHQKNGEKCLTQNLSKICNLLL